MTNGGGGDDFVLPGWTVDFDIDLFTQDNNEVTIDLTGDNSREFDLDLVAESENQVVIDLRTDSSGGDFGLDLIGENKNEVSLNLLYGGGNGDAWEGSVPPITNTTHIYQQDTAPDEFSVPPPKDYDFWYQTPSNKQYYYLSSAPGNHWVAVRDTGITDAQADADRAILAAAAAQSTATAARTNANIAIANAGTAQSTADGKVRSFFQDGPPSGMLYSDIGDMWFDTNDGNLLYQWDGYAWVVAQDQDIANAVTAAGEAQAIANTKITTFYQVDPPTSLAIGDLWVDTNDQNHLYRALMVGANEIRSNEWVSVRDAAIADASASAAAAQDAALDAMSAAAQAQATADGAIRTYYQSDPPAGLNDTDNLGDMWFDTDDASAWRWNGTDWVIIEDTAIATALAAAQNAQTTADGKINAFYQISPPVTADLGDLWYDTNDKNKPYFCSAIDPVEWTPIRDLTIADAELAATTANTAAVAAQGVADAAIASAATAQGIADGKTNTYFQLTEPTGMLPGDVDDLWFDIDDGNKMYRWTGTAWEVAQDQQIAAAITDAARANTAAGVANTLAGTKVVTFYQNNPPVALTIGDLWVDTDDGNKLYRASSIGVGGWESVQDKGIEAASAAASAANTAATNAMTAAQQAQATADGAVVTYYQTDPPWKVVPPAVDPSFEIGVNGFSVVGTSPPGSTITSDGGRYKTGARSLKMTAGGSAGLVSATKTHTGIVADKTYTVLVWAYAPTSITAGAASMSVRISGTTVAAAYNTTPSVVRDTWTPILTTYTAVASGTLTLSFNGSYGASQSTWWDDVAVVEGEITQNSVGDTWYDTDDNLAYRWTGTDWLLIVDTQITAALEAAKHAQTTADGKITAYYQTSQPVSGKLGDLWYDTDDKNKPYYCSSETPLTWMPIRDGTIADAQAAADAGIGLANDAKSSADGKATTYFQFDIPWPNLSPGHALDDGDLWFDTNDANKMYRWVDATKTWTLSDDQRIASTITTVNGKITTYYQDDVPTSTAVGDLWVDTNDDNHLYRAFAVGANTITAGKWVSVRDDTIADAQAAADKAVYSYVNEYAVNASETVPPIVSSPSWSTATPLRTPGTFIWVRTTTTRNDGTTTTSDPVLLTGNTGATPASITLTTSTQVLTQPAAGGVTTPSTAVVTGTAVSTTITKYEYSSDGGTLTTTPPPGVFKSGNVVTITGSTMTAKTIAVKMSDAANVSDTLTVARVNSGATGGTGGAGADAYTVLLTNEAHTFAGGVANALVGSTTSQVLAYKAAVQMPVTIDPIGTLPTGMTVNITNNGMVSAGFTVNVTTALVQQNGIITIPIRVDGVSFSKTFSWAVSLTGAKGDQGPVSPAVWLTTTSQVLTAPAGGVGATTPATAVITGNASSSTSITTFTYSTDGGVTFSATKPAGLTQTGLGPVTITGQIMTAKTIAVRAADAAGVSDTLTIAKVSDGVPGGAGTDGADAYTILLSNEANVFPGSTTAAYAGSTTSKVIAYKGATQVPTSIVAFGAMPSGMTAVATNNGQITNGFTVTVTTSLVTPSGTFDISITAGTLTFVKTFSWSLGLTGAKGDNAPTITMTSTSQVMSVAAGGAITPATVTVSGTATGTTIDRWEYSADGAVFTVTKPPGVAQSGVTPVTITGSTMTAKTIAVKMSNAGTGISDTITVAKVVDGASGADAYTVLLTNEAQVIPGTTTAGIAGTYTTQVIAYKGTAPMTASISNAAITGLPTGITSAVTGSGTASPTVTFTVTSSLTALGGQITIPVVVDSITFNKVFSWSLSLKGDPGANASTITLTASAQALVSPAAGGVTTPPQSVITATTANATIARWEASVNGAAFVALSTPPAGVALAGNVVTITGATLAAATKSVTIRMADAANLIYDTMTVSKVYDGAAGADAYTVMLTNEAQVIPAGVTNAVGGTYTSKVIAYKASTLMPVNITGITGQVTGLTAAVDAQNNTTNAGFTVTATTALATTAGTLTVTMVVDNVTFTKTFAWTLSLTGQAGVNAPTVTLTSPAQTLVSPAAGGATSPASTTVTGVATGTTISTWDYSVNGGVFGAAPAGVSLAGNVVTITGGTLAANVNTVAVRATTAAGIADTMTIAKVFTGADAYTVLLTNEAQVFAGTTNAALTASTTSNVLAYKGATQIVSTVQPITTGTTGITATPINPGSLTAGFTVSVGPTLLAQSGEFPVTILVDGISFTKRFSWSVSYTGPKGDPGGSGSSAAVITLTSTAQALVATPGTVPTSPTTAVITGTAQNTTIDRYEYSTDGGATWIVDPTRPTGVTRTGNAVTVTGGTMTANAVAVKMLNVASGVLDIYTVAKVSNGAGITGTTVTYQVGSSATTAPTGTWLANPPVVPAGQFLWTRTVTNYSDGTSNILSPAYAISPTGVGISNTVVTYQVGSSATTTPTGTWMSTPQATTPGTFLWTRTITTYTDASTSTAYSIAAHGAQGTAGTDAYTVLLSNEAAVFPGTTTTAANGGTASGVVSVYKGVNLISASVAQPTVPTGMTATLTNNPGTSPTYKFDVTTALVIPGGQVTLAITADGKTFNGIFSWAVSYTGPKGDTGTNAPTITLSAPTQILSVPAAGGPTTPVSTTVTGTSTITTISKREASVNGAAFVDLASSQPAGVGVPVGNAVTITGASLASTTKTVAIKMSDAAGVSDTMTVAKVADGAGGGIGGPGADAYTILLSNESHTFAGTSTAAVASSVPSKVIAYKGTTQIAATVTAITGQVTGMTAVADASQGTTNAGFIVSTTTSLITLQGTLAVTIVADTLTFYKTFSWTLSLAGTPAATVSLTSTTQALVSAPTGTGPTNPTQAVVTGTAVGTTITAWDYMINNAGGWVAAPAGVSAPTGTPPAVTITGGSLPAGTNTLAVRVTTAASGVTDTLTVAKLLNGAVVTSTVTTYQVHTNGTTAPTGTWLANPPVVAPGQFLWSRTITSYSDGTSNSASPAYAVVAPGLGISSTVITWQVSSSGTVTPTGTWLTSPPATTPGTFLWTRTETTYTDVAAPHTFSYSVSAHGATGNAGADAYTVLLTNQAQVFAGTTTNAVANAAAAVTNVVVYKGAVQISADLAQPTAVTGMTFTRTNNPGLSPTLTVGVTTALTGPTGTVPLTIVADGKTFTSIFSWAISFTGADATSIDLSSTSQALVASPGVAATIPPTAVVTGTATKTTIDKYEYSLDGSATWTNLSPTPPAYVVLDTTNKKATITGATLPSSTIAIRMSNTASGIADTMTVSKMLNGSDAYTVLLSNEAAIFAGTTTTAVAKTAAATTNVVVYKGGVQIPAVLSQPSAVTGMTFNVTPGTSPLLSIDVTTALLGPTGQVPLTITADGKTFTSIFSWAISFTGVKGDPGTGAITVALSSTTQSLVAPAGGGAGATVPTTAVVTGVAVGATIDRWEYSSDGGATWLLDPTRPAGVAKTGNAVTITGGSMAVGTKTIVVRATNVASAVSDTYTVAKIWDGAAGADAYTVLLSNEAAIFPGTATNQVVNGSQASGTVSVYKGATPINCVLTVPSTGSLPAGLTVVVAGTASAPTYAFTAATALVGASGQVIMKVVADGQTFNPVFSWSISYAGAPGVNAPTVSLTSPAQTLVSPAAGGATTPTFTTVTGTATGTTINKWESSINGAAFADLSPTPPPGVSAPAANVVTITGGTLAANVSTVALRATTVAGVADTMTIAKVFTGADAYTVLLSNEAAVFPGTTTAVVVGATATGTATVYKGATPITCTVTPAGTTGLTASAPATGTNPAYTYTAAAGLATNGQVNVTITADGKTFTTAFSWTISYTGQQGNVGTGISLITPFFAAVPITVPATPPVQPTNQAVPPDPPWKLVEPAWATGTELYRTDRISYTSGIFTYSAVTLVSSYTAASTKIQTYYLPGFTGALDTTWSDPDNPGATRNKWVPIPGHAVGDLWYQTDDDYHLWVWDGAVWLDATNPDVKFKLAIEQGEANTGQIGDLNTSLELTSSTAQSAQERALSADGRLTMSDYEPSPSNVAGRSQGSVWFTRTRKRTNLCTNPSFEAATTDWAVSIATMARVLATPAIDGNYVLQVTNTATATEHNVTWASAVAVRPKVTEGQTYTISVYVKHMVGAGKQFRLRILWYNAAQALIKDDYSPYVDISTPVPPAVTTDWVRLWITVAAPATADTFYVRINSLAANVNDVWQVDGLLVEQDDELGRYFDGDSFDGAWSNPAKPDLSTSTLVGDKISRVFELQDESWVRRFFSEDSLTSLNALKLVGTLNSAMIADDSIAPDKMATPQVVASEALTAGSMVNVWNDKGVFKVRKADASLGYEAHGFVVQAVAINVSVRVLFNGYNPYVANLVPGTQYLSTGGAVTAQPPSTTGRLVQRVGFAPLSVVLDFSPAQAIKIF